MSPGGVAVENLGLDVSRVASLHGACEKQENQKAKETA